MGCMGFWSNEHCRSELPVYHSLAIYSHVHWKIMENKWKIYIETLLSWCIVFFSILCRSMFNHFYGFNIHQRPPSLDRHCEHFAAQIPYARPEPPSPDASVFAKMADKWILESSFQSKGTSWDIPKSLGSRPFSSFLLGFFLQESCHSA